MPVRRGHVAPQNTFLDTIIRKFEGQSKYSTRVHFDDSRRKFSSTNRTVKLEFILIQFIFMKPNDNRMCVREEWECSFSLYSQYNISENIQNDLLKTCFILYTDHLHKY